MRSFGAGCIANIYRCSFRTHVSNSHKKAWGIHCGGGMGSHLGEGMVDAGTHLIISDNSWNFEGSGLNGIYITGIYPSNSAIDIFHNTFNFNVPELGQSTSIFIDEGDKYNLSISSNTFISDWNTILDWQDLVGIVLKGSESSGNNIVIDNRFPSDIYFPVLPIFSFLGGILVSNFDYTAFCSNTFYSSSQAIAFFEENMMTNFVANEAHAGAVIRIFEDGVIDDQLHKGNKWYFILGFPFYSTNQAELENEMAAQYSQFYVHTSQSTALYGTGFNPYHPRNITPDTDDNWWSSHSGSPIGNCVNQFAEPQVSKFKMDIADDLIGDFYQDSTREWLAKKSLYKTLKKYPDLVSEYSPFASFLAAYEDSPIGSLYTVSDFIEIIRCSRLSLLDSIMEDQIMLDSLITATFRIDSILDTTVNITTFSTNVAAKSDLAEDITNLAMSITEHNLVAQTELANSIDSIRSLNNAITPTNQVVIDEKTFNDIYLNLLENGILSEGEIDTLRSIAQKCPKISGGVVYSARGLLPDCVENYFSDTYEECYSALSEPEISEEEEERALSLIENENISFSKDVLIYPNPSKDEVQVKLSSDEDVELKIFDNIGRVQIKSHFKSTTVIDLEKLSTGVYTIQLNLKDGRSINRKLLIVK